MPKVINTWKIIFIFKNLFSLLTSWPLSSLLSLSSRHNEYLTHEFFSQQGSEEMQLYSLYHTSYETVRLVEKFMDPDYKLHLATTRTYAEITRLLADSPVLPFDVRLYLLEFFHRWFHFKYSNVSAELEDHGISLGKICSGFEAFRRR